MKLEINLKELTTEDLEYLAGNFGVISVVRGLPVSKPLVDHFRVVFVEILHEMESRKMRNKVEDLMEILTGLSDDPDWMDRLSNAILDR